MKNPELNQQEELTTVQMQQTTGGGFVDDLITIGTALGYGDAIHMFMHPFD